MSRLVALFIFFIALANTTIASPLFYADNITFNKAATQLIYTNPKADTLTAIDTRTGKVLRKIAIKLPPNALMIGATPDGFKLLYLSAKGLSVIHNGTGKVLRTLAHPRAYQAVYKRHLMAQNTNGSLIAIPYTKNGKTTLFMMHTGSGKIINQLALPPSRYAKNPIEAIAFSLNNRLLAYTRHSADDKGRLGSTLHIYDLYAKKELQSIFLLNHRYKSKIDTKQSPSNRIQFSQDGQKLVLSFQNKVTLLDRKTEHFKDYPARNSDAVFSANSQSVIYKSHVNNATLMVINVRSGKAQKIPAYADSNKQTLALVQSLDKRLIVLPILKQKSDKASFLIFNGQTGVFMRLLEEKSE